MELCERWREGGREGVVCERMIDVGGGGTKVGRDLF